MKPQTPPTSTEYVEPLGFKGTIGNWYITWENIMKIRHDDVPICIFQNYRERPETLANVQLMSQSKELAKALQMALERMNERADRNELEDEDVPVYQTILQVLKQAGLTE